MGKKSSSPQMMFLPQQQQTSSSTTNQLPQWVQDAGRANYDAAANMNPAAFAAYNGQRIADLNSGQLNAIAALNQNVGATNEAFQNAAAQSNAATSAATQGMGNASNVISGALNPQSVQQAISGLNNQVGSGPLGVNYTQGQYNQIGYSPSYNNVDYSGRVNQGIDYNNNPAQAAQNSIYNQLNSATGPQSIAQQAMGQTQDAAQSARGIGNINAQNVNAQTLPQGDLSAYMNPFTQSVIDSSLSTLDKQRQQALNSNADAAINARAFGGSRAAIQDAVTNSQFGSQAAQLAANLNNQNFQQAQTAMQADQGRNLQAQLANQQAGLQASTTNQGKDLNVANMGLNAANQFGSLGLNNAQFMTQAANTMGNLGLSNKGQDINAQQALLNSALSQRGQNLDAQRANQSAALQSAGLGLQAQQANMNAAFQDRMNAANVAQMNQSADLQNKNMNIGALQNAGSLGLNNAQLGVAAGNNLANIANNQGALGQSNASLMGSLANNQQANYLNSLNAALAGSGMMQAQNQNQLDAQRQFFADQQNSMLAPLNLRMQALGMTPYNTSTSSTGSSFGLQGQAYQPTSSSPLSTAAGLAAMGAGAYFGGPAGAAAGRSMMNGLLGSGGAGQLGSSGMSFPIANSSGGFTPTGWR